MKPLLLLFCVWGLLFSSCEKNNSATLKDEIIYKNILPDKEIQTVRFYTIQDHSVCTANIPTPSDSSVSYDLDLDNDNVMDFRINVVHSKYNAGYCGHCDVFTYNISIEGLSVKDSIAHSSTQYGTPGIFSESDVIDSKKTWLSRADILLLEGCSLPFHTDFANGYIGIKMNKSYGYIKIEKMSNNGIRILEHGFNKTPDNKISCGQTK